MLSLHKETSDLGEILQQWEVLCTPLRTLLVASGEPPREGCETDIELNVQPCGCVVRLHLAASTFSSFSNHDRDC
jgi:hypothetical protein